MSRDEDKLLSTCKRQVFRDIALTEEVTEAALVRWYGPSLASWACSCSA